MHEYKIRKTDSGDPSVGISPNWRATNGVDEADGESPIHALLLVLEGDAHDSGDRTRLLFAIAGLSRLASYLTGKHKPPAVLIHTELDRLTKLLTQLYPQHD